ncbi:MAG: heparinase II/III family protein, partial [Oscillospiraceae bacterium]
MYNIGLTFREFKKGERWQDLAIQRLPGYTKGYIQSDGTIKEVALGYVNYALGGITNILTYSDQMNVKLDLPEEMMDTLKLMANYLVYISAPGGRETQQGDAYAYSATSVKNTLQSIWEWSGDEYAHFVGTNGKEGTMPSKTSEMFDVGKKYAMRSDWNLSANFLHTNADSAYESHGHADDLSIVVWAYNKYLLADPLYSSYQGGGASNWLTSTSGHNTVMVNNATQTKGKNTMGITNYWEANNTYDFLDVSTKNYRSQKVEHSRQILFVRPGYWLVSDYMVPTDAESKNYKQSWHFLPDANLKMDLKTGVTKTNFADANIHVATAINPEVTPVFKTDGYYGMGHSGIIKDVKYSYYEQNKKGPAVFNTVLYPEEIGKNNKVTVTNTDIELDGIKDNGVVATSVKIDDKKDGVIKDGAYYLVHDKEQKAVRNFGNFTTDGTMTYAEKQNGKINMIAYQGGTKLTDLTGAYYLKSDVAVEDLGINYNNDILVLSSSKNVDLDKLTVFAPKNIAHVKFNDKEIPFKRGGEYVYFGNAPILDVNAVGPKNDEKDEETPKPPTPILPPHGGGSGGGGGGNNGGGNGGGSIVPPIPTPTATPVNPSMNQNFAKELENHWGKKEITKMIEAGIVNGENEKTLGLQNETTRAEFVTMLVRALKLDIV